MNIYDVTNFLGVTNTKDKEPNPAANPRFNLETAGEKKTLYKWEAPSRIQKKGFDQKTVKTMLIIFSVVALLLIIMQEFFLILVIASLAFVSYILTATPPETLTFELSTHGVNYSGQFYYWNDLKSFFITQNDDGSFMLNIDVLNQLPGRLFMIIKSEDKEAIREIVNRYLPEMEGPPTTVLDKAMNSVKDKFDLSGK